MIGLNVLAQFTRDPGALKSWVKRARPGVMVVMDDPTLAQQIKRDAPAALVIHRTYNPNDHRWHEVVSPAEWLAMHRGTVANGVVLQVMNEPAPGDVGAFLTWLEELVRLTPSDVTLALPAFAVGNPHEDMIRFGSYDRLIRLLSRTRHYLMLHEYFKDNPPAEAPYLCGRFAYWLDRAKAIGVPPPKIVLGEYGRDLFGGFRDGWRGAGFSEQQYAELLISTHKRLYAPHGIAAAVFCYGYGGGERWTSYDVEGANTVLDAIAAYNAQAPAPVPPTVPTPPATFKDGVITAVVNNFVNVRAAASASAAVLTTLRPGAAVRYSPTPINGGAYTVGGRTYTTWIQLEAGGFIAAAVVTIGDAADRPDQPVRRLEVPYISQLGADADRRNNDCGVACALMLIQYALKRAGLRPMRALTVDRLIDDTALATTDAPLGLAQVVALLDAYGVAASVQRPITADALVKLLDAGKPPILLVNYQPIGGQRFGHYVIPVAYGEKGFWIHDPYTKGADVYITRSALEAAQTDISPFAAFPYQGITLS